MTEQDLLSQRPSLHDDSPRKFLAWARRMRDHQPVVYDDAGGTWQVFRYEDALRISSDPATFSNELQRVAPVQQFTAGNIGAMDPPKHCRVRTLVSHAFTARTVTDLAGRVTELTRELLDVVADRDEFDLVGDFSYPLPVIVIAELLGVPATDRDLFRGWVDAMLAPTYKRLADLLEEQELMSAYAALDAYLLEHVRDRRRCPKGDLISRLNPGSGRRREGLDDEGGRRVSRPFLLLGGPPDHHRPAGPTPSGA
nr:putative EryK-like hydroxylase [uncultured bacterium]